MSLSDQELKEIAYLARINVKDESLSSLKVTEETLSFLKKVNEADTSDVDAMSHPLDLSQPVRKDEVTKNEREELLKNAPSAKSGLFLVPKVIEGEASGAQQTFLSEIKNGLEKGDFTSTELTHLLERIEKYDKQLNSLYLLHTIMLLSKQSC